MGGSGKRFMGWGGIGENLVRTISDREYMLGFGSVEIFCYVVILQCVCTCVFQGRRNYIVLTLAVCFALSGSVLTGLSKWDIWNSPTHDNSTTAATAAATTVAVTTSTNLTVWYSGISHDWCEYTLQQEQSIAQIFRVTLTTCLHKLTPITMSFLMLFTSDVFYSDFATRHCRRMHYVLGLSVCQVSLSIRRDSCYHDISWTPWTILIKLTGKVNPVVKPYLCQSVLASFCGLDNWVNKDCNNRMQSEA